MRLVGRHLCDCTCAGSELLHYIWPSTRMVTRHANHPHLEQRYGVGGQRNSSFESLMGWHTAAGTTACDPASRRRALPTSTLDDLTRSESLMGRHMAGTTVRDPASSRRVLPTMEPSSMLDDLAAMAIDARPGDIIADGARLGLRRRRLANSSEVGTRGGQ